MGFKETFGGMYGNFMEGNDRKQEENIDFEKYERIVMLEKLK